MPRRVFFDPSHLAEKYDVRLRQACLALEKLHKPASIHFLLKALQHVRSLVYDTEGQGVVNPCDFSRKAVLCELMRRPPHFDEMQSAASPVNNRRG